MGPSPWPPLSRRSSATRGTTTTATTTATTTTTTSVTMATTTTATTATATTATASTGGLRLSSSLPSSPPRASSLWPRFPSPSGSKRGESLFAKVIGVCLYVLLEFVVLF